jgi:NIMA (never in mitosis gene a)-related kinase 1/4/5
MTTLKPPFRANDMNGLYKRVLKGAYPKISPTYTQDLATMIKTLLQVEPGLRPTCDQILAMDVIKKRMPLMKNLPADPEITVEEAYANLNLLNTIKLPKNLANLTKDLPKSNYISNRGDSAALSIPPGSKKLVQSHPGQLRL